MHYILPSPRTPMFNLQRIGSVHATLWVLQEDFEPKTSSETFTKCLSLIWRCFGDIHFWSQTFIFKPILSTQRLNFNRIKQKENTNSQGCLHAANSSSQGESYQMSKERMSLDQRQGKGPYCLLLAFLEKPIYDFPHLMGLWF